MTRRQWMWLWIWLLLFFIIFCIWNKLQSMQDDAILATAKPVVIENETNTAQKEQALQEDKTDKKDLTFKIVKDRDTVKLSGVFPSQKVVDDLIQTLETVGSKVQKGTIIIDKEANNPNLLQNIKELSDDFSKFKNGYIEYHDKKMTIDGIVDQEEIKERIKITASKNGDYEVANMVIVEEEPTKIQQPQIIEVKPPSSNEQEKTQIKEKEDKKALQRKKVKERRNRSKAQAQLDRILRSKPVEFIYAKDELTKKSKRLINQVYAVLKKYPDIKVKIAGHTDSDGTKENNLKLSQKRADAIKRYLVKKGIKEDRLTAIGYGESRPLVKNDTAAHKQINRRVEFRVIK